MGATLSGKFKIGEPDSYVSIYGYDKQLFPVLNEQGFKVGAIKEETVMDGAGNVVSKTYYTRNIGRPHGVKRFYDSPQSLVIAFGGEIDRVTAPKAVKVKAPRAKKETPPVKKSRAVSPVAPAPRKKKIA